MCSDMRSMMQSVKTMLEGCLNKCGGPDCERVKRQDGSDLMQCARYVVLSSLREVRSDTCVSMTYRCKSAVYVSNLYRWRERLSNTE